MMFLIRTAFWISVLLLVLPLGGAMKGDGPNAEERASIDAMAALAAAGATISDMRSFCERQPDACDVGSKALQVMSDRARNGAAMIQDYLGSEGAPAAPAKAVSTATGGRDTLTPADRKPSWRGPGSPSA
ncbi:DUF5330 domain-containing protein [Methylopila sp. Yamaguchi]|uniref:DUF5330 domain-containing protein n=1 Tax=Methylopila sp. Yamaguchi TaxID=1437817 RepID=UPI000CB9B5B6|nr:DUF5330 domain-containing protein [Methylopila sp. Yamaguchi]GBD49106.1 hypothetical protein METY_2319 [Methylopila sp. Yamaguchi]